MNRCGGSGNGQGRKVDVEKVTDGTIVIFSRDMVNSGSLMNLCGRLN